MSNTRPSTGSIKIGSIRITGAAAGTGAARLAPLVRRGLGQALAGPPRPTGSVTSIDIPRLRLRLPAGAGEPEIAAAVAAAVARVHRGGKP